MPNVMSALFQTMKSFADIEPKPPLHIGEAMNCWTYLAALEEANSFVEVGLNSTVDTDLKIALRDALKMCSSQINVLKEFMKNEGIPLPSASESKPEGNPEDIPYSVKLTDYELANGLATNSTSSIVLCASTVAESLRSDVGIMFLRFQMEQTVFGTTLKHLMKKRGWLKIPPSYKII